ncbi:hypothetical protein BGZ89_006169, partial [Linnemannia elongata]
MRTSTLITILAALAVIQSAPVSTSNQLVSVEKRHANVLPRSFASHEIDVAKRHAGAAPVASVADAIHTFMRRDDVGNEKKKRSLSRRAGNGGSTSGGSSGTSTGGSSGTHTGGSSGT